jgi:FHS family L-fucose permease-like MFS transporter
MGIIVKNQFEVSNAMSQLGNFANFIAYAFLGLPAGFILKRKGYKFTALAAVTVGFVGVAISFLSGVVGSFGVYLLGAFVSGFSMCMLNTVVNPMLNTLGGGGNKGNQLIQFAGSCNSLAATIVPVFVGYLMGDAAKASIQDANPALFIAMGVFALAFVILFFSHIPEPELEAAKVNKEKEEGTMTLIKGALSYKHFVFGIIAIFLYVGIEVGVPNTVNLYLTSIGIETSTAGAVVGIYWLLMLVGRLVGGVLGAKISSRTMVAAVSGLALVFLVLGILLPEKIVSFPSVTSELKFAMAQIPLGAVLFVLCGLCTSVMWGAIFNLAVEGLGKYTSIASGLFMVMVCGGGIVPVIQNAVADASGFIPSFWVLVVAVAYILWYALLGSKVKKA